MPLKTYRELDVWKVSMDLLEAVYSLTKLFPDVERYALTTQIQRAAVSIPSNIAEGYGRAHRAEYLHMLSIAKGSLAEVETQLLIAHRLGYCSREQLMPVWRLTQRVGRMLRAQLRSLRKSPK